MGKRIIEIEPMLLVGLMEQGNVIGEGRVVRVIEGIPPGATIVRCWVKQFIEPHGTFVLLLEHESWSETVPGGEYQHFMPVFQEQIVEPSA